MEELVRCLADEQPIVASLRPAPSVAALKAAIDRGWVHVRFPNTQGGTELGVPIDRDASDLAGADFGAGEGQIRLVGNLVLDDVPVRFEGVLALETLAGRGLLRPLPSGGAA